MSTVQPATFPEIYERHHDAIRDYLRARVRDDALADDLAAETFTRAYAARERFVDQGHGMRPWLYAIATNLLRDELRAGTRRAALLERLPADAPAPEPAGPPDPVLAAALHDLRREELEVLLLSAWADLSYDEIATALDLPVGTVRSRLHRARKHLRKALAAGVAAGLALVTALALLPGDDQRRAARSPLAPLGGPEPASARAACARPGSAGVCLHAVSQVAGLAQLPGRGDVLYERGSYVPLSFRIDDQPSGPGNHRQVRRAQTPFYVIRRATEERWVAPDGTVRLSSGAGGPARPATAADAAAWKAAGAPDLERLIPQGDVAQPLAHLTDPDEMLGANGLSDQLPDDDPLAELPRDTAQLAARLHEMAWKGRIDSGDDCPLDLEGCSSSQRTLVQQTQTGFIATLLGYPATPADLRAALIRVLAATAGSRSAGLLRAPDGSRVAAVRLAPEHAPDGLDIIAFDPDTGALRGQAQTGVDRVVRWLRTNADVRSRVPAVGERP